MQNTTHTQNLDNVKSGWLIFNPKGNHFFKAYDGNGGYYSVSHPEDAYLFLSEHNAVTMAKRLFWKTSLVAKAEISVHVDFAASQAVQGRPLDVPDAPDPKVPEARIRTSHVES